MALSEQTPGSDWSAALLALLMAVVPAVGVPNNSLLQGTLKAAVVVFFTLAAALAFGWHLRHHPRPHFHRLLGLPMALLAYALASMVWSHGYLAGVEAVRWFFFTLLLWLGLNSLTRQGSTWLIWGIHVGASLAALWAALQFWFDWQFFPQGPNPASTFANRNFFAEYLLCTLPFSVRLLSRLQSKAAVFLLTFSIAFELVALMMTGTRSALVSLLLLGLLLPAIAWRYRQHWRSTHWQWGQRLALALLVLATLAALGSIKTGNPQLAAESGYGSGIDRTLLRSLSVSKADEYSEGSSSQRLTMWKATLRMLAANPLAGVGAGAWEVQIPHYQEANTVVEYSDFAHNELLQLVAEYGLVGGLFLLGLLAYLVRTAYATWSDRSPDALREAPLRAFTLASLLALLLVSNAGFPWHMASTSALFALNLGLLAAIDVRLAVPTTNRWRSVGPGLAWLVLSAAGVATVAALYVTQRAVASENRLLLARDLAARIAASGQPQAAHWQSDKMRVLQLVREGIARNPHERQLSAEVADAMAGWGDMSNASWIWQSVLASRPNIVAMLAYVARAHLLAGEIDTAQSYLKRAQALQAQAPMVLALEVMLLSRTGQESTAAARAQSLLQSGVTDPDLVAEAYALGQRLQRPALSILALQRGIAAWPQQAWDGWLLLGDIYASVEAKDEAQALQAYRSALALAPNANPEPVLERIPRPYRDKL